MADDKKIIFSMVGVSKMFPPHKQVLKDIYLSFFYGAKIGIIGLNGSGKSTLLTEWRNRIRVKWYSRRGIRWGISNRSPNSTLRKQ